MHNWSTNIVMNIVHAWGPSMHGRLGPRSIARVEKANTDWFATVVLDDPTEFPSTAEATVATTPITPTQSTTKPGDQRADIDGLRGVAILAVITFHIDPHLLPGGFAGVDIFFVISGFVVSQSLLRGIRQQPAVPAALAAFYGRRVKRLAPALAISVAAASTAVAFLLPPGLRTVHVADYYLTAQLAMVGMANNLLMLRERSYWEQQEVAERNPFIHTWSLGVEEQYYLIFPLLATVVYSRRASACCFGRVPACCFLACSLASLSLAIHLTATGQHRAAFYLLPPRLWELACGALLFECQRLPPASACRASLEVDAAAVVEEVHSESLAEERTRQEEAVVRLTPMQQARHRGTLCYAKLRLLGIEFGLLLLLAVAMLRTPSNRAAGGRGDVPVLAWSLPAVAAAAGLMALGSPSLVPPRYYVAIDYTVRHQSSRAPRRGGVPSPLLSACLGWAPLAYVGRISYPLYLTHHCVFSLYRWTVGLHTRRLQAGALALIALLSISIHHLCEQPIRRWQPRRASHVLAAGFGLTTALELWLGLLRGPVGAHLSVLGADASLLGQGSLKWRRNPSRPPPLHPPSPAPPPPVPPPTVPVGSPQHPPPPPLRPPSPAAPLSPSAPPHLSTCACSNRRGPAHTLHEPSGADPSSSRACLEVYDSYDWSTQVHPRTSTGGRLMHWTLILCCCSRAFRCFTTMPTASTIIRAPSPATWRPRSSVA